MPISTRKPQDDPHFEVVLRLQKVIEESVDVINMSRVVGTQAFVLSDDLDTLLGQVGHLLNTMQEVGIAMTHKVIQVTQDNMALAEENFHIALQAEAMSHMVSKLSNVPFDQALDHTTADLMMTLESSGVAESNAHGDIAFDPSITVSKSDLKPIMKETIDRWIEYRTTL